MRREDAKDFLCALCASAVAFFDVGYVIEMMPS
jgi:hypothetical protein